MHANVNLFFILEIKTYVSNKNNISNISLKQSYLAFWSLLKILNMY